MFSTFFIFGFIWQVGCYSMNNNQTLLEDSIVLVNAIWRHGARNVLQLYKNDPNREDDWQFGLGNLLPVDFE
jgi:hypothetical protein